MFNRKSKGLSSATYSLKDFVGMDEKDPALLQSLMTQVMELEVKLRDQQDMISYLEKDAMTDSLTGLVNRRVFEDELTKSLSYVQRHNCRSAILYIDVDAFKSINDEFGHLAGDQALVQIAGILKNNVRPTDVVARLGGDEFCIILNDVDTSYDVKGRAEVIESLVARTPLLVNDKSIHLTVSIGSRTFGGKDTFEEIMGDADMMMYSRKAEK